MKWISVKDRLPEYMDVVIIYNEFGQRLEAQYTGSDNEFTVGDHTHYASHWMDFPEAPK